MLRLSLSLILLSSLFSTASVQAQIPASPEHKLLQRDVGTWDAVLKMWIGPDGKADPKATPEESKGTEVNRMLGEFWCLSEFKGEFAGMEFEGHSIGGYDPQQKKFVGSWTDSVSPFAMHMTGTYDEDSETLSYDTKGVGMDGKEAIGKSTVKYVDENTRVMTMYEVRDGKDIKSMEITYTRAKK